MQLNNSYQNSKDLNLINQMKNQYEFLPIEYIFKLTVIRRKKNKQKC